MMPAGLPEALWEVHTVTGDARRPRSLRAGSRASTAVVKGSDPIRDVPSSKATRPQYGAGLGPRTGVRSGFARTKAPNEWSRPRGRRV